MGGSVPVAVRSSATAEDLPFASFAGQQDSFLDVTGADAVVEAVRRCWASLWSERAVAYRSANGISNRDVGLAVVVQVWSTPPRRGPVYRKPRHRDPDGNGDQRQPGLRSGRGLGVGQPGPVRTGDGVRPVTRSTPGRAGIRTEPEPGRPPAPGTHRAWGTASSASLGRRRTSSGPLKRAARSGSPSHARSPRCIRCPSPHPRRRRRGGRGPHPGVPLRHPVPGADPADHAAGAGGPRDDAQQQGTLAVHQPRAADVRGPHGRGPQQIGQGLSAADPPARGRQIRGRASGAARGS